MYTSTFEVSGDMTKGKLGGKVNTNWKHPFLFDFEVRFPSFT